MTVKPGFTVNRVGKVEDIKVIESVNPSPDSEAVRVIPPGYQQHKKLSTFVADGFVWGISDK